MCDEHQQEHQRGDHHRVAEIGGVARRDAGTADGRDVHRGAVVAEEARAAVGEVRRGQHDRDRARQHQRDQGQVQPAQSQGREPDQRPRGHRDQASLQQYQGKGLRRGEQEPGGHPGADREHRGLAERDQADPADQHPEPERDHAVHRHLRHRVDVVQAQQQRQREQHEEQERGDHGGPHQGPGAGPAQRRVLLRGGGAARRIQHQGVPPGAVRRMLSPPQGTVRSPGAGRAPAGPRPPARTGSCRGNC